LPQNYLVQFLTRVPEDQVVGHILAFANASRGVSDERIRDRVDRAIHMAAASMPSPGCRLEAESLLQVFALETMLLAGQPVEQISFLAAWSGKEHLWTYPWALDLLLTHGGYSERLEQESLHALNQEQQQPFNTYFFLALTLAERYAETESQERSRIAETYLVKNIDEWKSGLTARMNMRVYGLLYRLNRSDTSYMQEYVDWQKIKLHKDHLQLFPSLVRQGRYFLIFRDYFDSMRIWGLHTELSPEQFYLALNVSPEARTQAVQVCTEPGFSVPTPIIPHNDGHVVSSEFLSQGGFLFTPPSDSNPILDTARSKFDMRAKEALPDLLNLIFSLENLPGQIKQLLEKYAESLLTGAMY
jgi:hypothetical protein